MSTSSLRTVIGARVSVFDDASKVSHTEQTRVCQQWSDRNGHTVVGSFEDLGVSAGKYTPWEREGLGGWLKPERMHEWDALVFAKMDRAFRSTRDCVDLARFAEQHRKVLVFVDDGLTVNYLDPKPGLDQMMAELFVYIGAFFAQLELHRFQQRTLDTHRAIRLTAKFTGKPPYGFTTAPAPDGKGKVLVHVAEEQAVLHGAAQKVLDGASFTNVAADLNREAVPAPEARSGKWSPKVIQTLLSKPSTQGFKLHKGQLVLDANSEPIRVGPPTFDDATWQQLQTAVERRKYAGNRRVHTPNPLSGVAFCGCRGCDACAPGQPEVGVWPAPSPCGAQLSQRTHTRGDKTWRYMTCYRGCKSANRRLDDLIEYIEGSFIEQYGPEEVTEVRFIPGTNNLFELDQLAKSINRLKAESDAGLIDDEAEYLGRLSALVSRRRELEKNPVTPARWEKHATGQTYAQLWADPNTDRATVLREAGFRLEVVSKLQMAVHQDLDSFEPGVEERLQQRFDRPLTPEEEAEAQEPHTDWDRWAWENRAQLRDRIEGEAQR
ncbi:recombinase family protein [Gordonia terrae]